ncbi:MAG: IS256 family transposase [Actinomycetota bacterium]|nr:IS256 family transposase [Actinomycetota bacterium]
MSKVADVRVLEAALAAADPDVSESVQVALTDIAATAREGLLALSVSVGLAVMSEMMQAEITAKVGPKHAKLPDRTAVRHSSADTSVVLGGRKVAVRRPRARTLDGQEVALESFAAFADEDQLDNLVFERMLAGLATRRHRAANEPVGEAVEAAATSTSKSAVSRRFVRATARELDELLSRDLSQLDVAGLIIDGIHFAEHCCVVALAISADGAKTPVGLWLGDTENKRVATDLLADLVARGLSADDGLLVVIDGAKALRAAVDSVFGDRALVQRCTLHKRRNVTDYLPKEQRTFVDRKLAAAFNDPGPAKELRAAQALARSLDAKHPDAAASLREGLDEMFTVRRLGVGDRLARSLSTTNAVESMISVARDTTRRVKRWRDGTMVKRWVAAGLLNAERNLRRIKGCNDMPILVAALRRHVHPDVTPVCEDQQVA